MRHNRLSSFLFLFLLLSFVAGCVTTAAASSDDWLPVSQEDLSMKDFAASSGSHAVILYRRVEHNDKEAWEKQYYRIKILDEEGKERANVETDTVANGVKISDLMARTIHADGTIVPFTGKATDKLVAKYKSAKLNTKVFTMPDVQVGSIIEYRYTLHWDSTLLYDSRWDLQTDIPTRDAEFSMTYDTSSGYNVSWLTYFLPKDNQPKDTKGTVSLKVHNMPPLEKEDYMPPEKEIVARVEFTYLSMRTAKLDDYWKDSAKGWYQTANEFMNKKKAAQSEVDTLTSANDTPEQKLRKLYDRVQKLRNLTYESEKSEKEQEREKLKDNAHIEDVLKHGYGYHNQLVRTFVALARAAGFDANLIRVIERDEYFHHKEVPKFNRYDTELAIVTVDGKELYLDPGVPYCPFGLLSWEDTETYGLLLNKDGAVWKMTPRPQVEDDVRHRVVDLQIDRDGTLTGQLHVSFERQEALYKRLAQRENDAAARKKSLEEQFKDWLPAGSAIEFTKIDDWSASTPEFVVDAKITVPNFGAPTGKRLLIPASVFPGSDKNFLQHSRRVNALYLRNPYRESDEISVKVPEGLAVETLPAAQQIPAPFADLQFSATQADGVFKINRQVVMKGFYYTPEQYPYVRAFLDRVKTAGEEQVVLRASAK